MTAAPSPHPRIRILLAGLGSIGQRHARLLAERPDVELILCDPIASHRGAVQAMLSRPALMFEAYDAALATRPDLVFLCTPNQLHVPMGLVAIAAGADVFVEKPIAETVREAEELVGAAAAAGRLLHVGYMLRFDPGLLALKRCVGEGAIGTLCGGRAMVGSYVTLLNSRQRDKETRPGSLVVDYTHEIDYLRWFFGEVADVQAAGATLGALERLAQPNIFQAQLRMVSGALVQLHLDYLQYPQRRSFELFGDRGTLSYDFMTGEIRRFAFEREHRWTPLDVPPLMQRVDNLFRAEHDAVLRCRAEGAAPLVGGADGLAALRVAEMAMAGARALNISQPSGAGTKRDGRTEGSSHDV